MGNFLRGYQTARIDLKALGYDRLSFHTYLRGTTDFLKEGPSDPKADVLNGYLRYAGEKLTFKAGRQQVYEGVGIGTMDGAYVGVHLGDIVHSSIYVGTESPLNESFEIASWNDRNMFGVHLESFRISKTDIGLSYVRKERNEDLFEEVVGADLRRELGRRLNIYGRLDWDLIQDEPRRIEGVTRVSPSEDLHLTGEFIRRTPRVNLQSIFKNFPLHTNFEAGLSGSYRMSSLLTLNGRYALVQYDYDKDNSQRIDFGFNIKDGTIGYTRRMGYGGERDGVYGGYLYTFSDDLCARAHLEITTYRLLEEEMERDDLLTSSVGVQYKPAKNISFNMEGQGLRNKLYEIDFRVLFRAEYWVSGM